MSFTFSCPFCGKKLEAEGEFIGKSANCPACDALITVPSPTEEQKRERYQALRGKQAREHSEAEKSANLKVIISRIRHGDYEPAFAAAINGNCTIEDILIFLLEISYRDHDYDTALRHAEKLIELKPDSPIGYRWKAEILDDGFGKMEESMEYSTKAIELNPKDALAYTIRGNTKRWMRPPDNKGAFEDYMKAIEIDETCSSAYSGLGWLHMRGLYTLAQKDKNSAEIKDIAERTEKLFYSAIGAEGIYGTIDASYGAMQGMAALLEFKGCPESEFMPPLEKAIELSPKFSHAYIQRANAKLKRVTPPMDEIIQDYAKAIAFTQDFSKIDRDWLRKLKEFLDAYC